MIGIGWQDVPGVGNTFETQSNEFRWGKGGAFEHASAWIDAATRDAGSTPTNFLRAGLLLGQIAATGKMTAYGAGNADGSSVVSGILVKDINILDGTGAAVDKWTDMVVAGPVRPANLFGFDENARQQMVGRFLFDDRAYTNQRSGAGTLAKPLGYTVLPADSGDTFTTTGATGLVTFVLPAPSRGLRYRFVNTVNQTMRIQAPAGKLVGLNGAAYTTLTFSTAGQLIGAAADVIADDTGAFWLAIPLGSAAATYA